MGDAFDLVIIGAGEAGQAAAYLARARGASITGELLEFDLLMAPGYASLWKTLSETTVRT